MVLFYRLVGSFAAASCAGSLLIIFTFLLVKPIRKHPTSLIFNLAICDFFFSLKYLVTSVVPNSRNLQDHPHSAPCYLQAIFGQFWGLATLGWIGMIAINLVFNLRNPFVNTASYEKWYHFWVWGYAAVTTIIMCVYGLVGEAGDGTCWIKQNSDEGKTNFFILTFIIPMIVYFLIAIVALLYAQARSADSFEGQTKLARSINFRMRIFVIVFIFLWSGTIVHRLTQIQWSLNHDISVLVWWEGICVSIQGFFNSLIWLTHPLVFRSFRDALGCCWKQASDRVPLLGRIQTELEDQQDIQRMDVLMRKSIITCILLGLKQSINIRTISQDENFFDSYKDVYSTKKGTTDGPSKSNQMLMQELSASSISELSKVKLNYSFKDFEPQLFEKLREADNISKEAYLEALNPEQFLGNLKNQTFSEGRSGSFFCFSPDKNFILKTIEPEEAKVLKKMLPSFYEHIVKYPKALLNRLYGFHSVKIHQMRIYVMVMGNVFNTKLSIDEKYDLKFSWVKRFVKDHSANPSKLGKDKNLKRKLKLDPMKKKELMQQIEADATFLASNGIMDYSLLIGFHFNKNQNEQDVSIMVEDMLSMNNSSNELLPKRVSNLFLENKGVLSSDGQEVYFIGMIDILQSYNFNKKMERFTKVYLLRNDKVGLSVQPVNVYLNRFISSLKNIIQSVDDTS